MLPAPIPILILPSVVESLRKETLAQVSEFHEKSPLQRGISKEELRKRVYDDLPLEVFRFCLDGLVEKRELSFKEDIVSLHGREVQLTTQSMQIKEMIEAFFLRADYQPPTISELSHAIAADPDEVRRIFFWMIKEKILVKISDDFAYHRTAIEEIKKTLRANIASGAKFGVADFKQMFNLTRKHAIPLLEYLDREKFTRRQGNDRILV